MSETNKTYRNAGFYKFGDGFTIQNNAPIDCRTYVNNITDIYDDANWTGANVKPYPGMIVSAPSGDVKIYVGEVITDIAAVTSSTEQIAWRNKANWLDVNIPKIEPEDAGRLLTIVETTNDDQTKSYSAQWVDAPSGLPTMGQSEAGKLLTVVETSTGSGVYVAQWVDAPSGLPTINGTSDANKVLQVNADGTGVTWVDAPEELPTIGPGSAGKVLTVSSDGINTEWKTVEHPNELPDIAESDKGKALTVDTTTGKPIWSTVDTSLMIETTTLDLFTFASRGLLKPGMKYRIMDYNDILSVNLFLEYQCIVNGQTLNIGVEPPKFDIIATASSESTIFDDVELVLKKNVTSPFDYTKYEAKYDLFGNTRGRKYNYIQPEGLGVIYYMKDEFGNEASFDFENIGYTGQLVHGILIHTFEGIKYGDLRQYGHIKNVRIKHSPNDLPSIVLLNDNTNTNVDGVEFDNCRGIYIANTNLHHSKISNSTDVSITMGHATSQQYYPTFENLNICKNESLNITCEASFNELFEAFGGLYINNLNFLPSFTQKLISVEELLVYTSEIIIQGLNDSNIVRKLRLTPENEVWIFALINAIPEACNLLFANTEAARAMIVSKYDTIVYDSIFNASKNIKPFDIFNPSYDDNSTRVYSLEIPHFQSTATSVVELGI